MGKRGIALVIVGALVLGWWFFARGTDDPLPSPEIALALARDDWQGYCDDPDAEWPCVIVTRIELFDRGAKPVEAGEEGYCFDVYFHIETSRWNEAEGIPAEPRSYVAPFDPVEQCATFSHNGVNDEDDIGAWGIHLAGDHWYAPLLDQMYEPLR